jgi:Uma2 family endonuclease
MSLPATSDAQSRPPVPVRRFTVAEYRRLGEAGILTEHDRVELLEGWIVPKLVHNPPHDNAIELCDDAVRSQLPAGWTLRVQSVVTTADSEPEPDLAVVRGSARERGGRHPRPKEVGLVIEVADSSLQIDRESKVRVYARAGIPAYWIVNLVDRQVEVLTSPSGSADHAAYGHRTVLGKGDEVALVLDGDEAARIAIDDLLP